MLFSKSEANPKLLSDHKLRRSLDFQSMESFEVVSIRSNDSLAYSSISTHEFVQVRKVPKVGGVGNFIKSRRARSLTGKDFLKSAGSFDGRYEEGSTEELSNRSSFSFKNFVEEVEESEDLFNVEPVLSGRVNHIPPKIRHKRREEDQMVLDNLVGAKKSFKRKRSAKVVYKAHGCRGASISMSLRKTLVSNEKNFSPNWNRLD